MNIFLDIDGVLNRSPAYPVFDRPRFDADLVGRLYEIFAAVRERKLFGPSLVLISNWKGLLPVESVFKLLYDAGLPWFVPWAGATANRPTRGEEVVHWFTILEPAPYVILDDRTDYLPGQHLVQTDPQVGLTADHVNRAIEYLLMKEDDHGRTSAAA